MWYIDWTANMARITNHPKWHGQVQVTFLCHHTVVWLGHLVYFGITNFWWRFSRTPFGRQWWNLAWLWVLVRSMYSHILVNFGLGHLEKKVGTPTYTNLTWEKTSRRGLVGQSELGAAVSRKAVWWDLCLVSLLTHLFNFVATCYQ